MLRQAHEKISKMIEEAEKNGDEEEAQRQRCLLQKVEEQLNNKNDERRTVKFGLKNKSAFKLMTELSINNS